MAQVPGSFTLSTVTPRCSPSGQLPGVQLNWTASSGATSYEVYRNGTLFGSSNDTSYESYNNFTAGQTYSFFIRARNSAGTRDSNTVSVTIPTNICTPTPPPSPPPGPPGNRRGTISGLSPFAISAGSPDFLLTVNGLNLVTDSVVRWNGQDRATSFLSSAQLRAVIPASDIASVGTASITVFDPSSRGRFFKQSVFPNHIPGTDSLLPRSNFSDRRRPGFYTDHPRLGFRLGVRSPVEWYDPVHNICHQ